tara:strand:+ start:633 stop:1517 length:885 start_codon:yes stop_codon:yes gene_type:complete
MSFLDRLQELPYLGIGISTEYGAIDQPHALDPLALRAEQPHFAGFLEVGVEVSKGLDRGTLNWCKAELPTTYHFLDVNLDEPEDLDTEWLHAVQEVQDQIKPAWMCGDAGLWHFGPRERGHMLLLPPILSDESARDQATGIARLREHSKLEVLPENPPGQLFVGDLHILDYYARVADYADTGLLLDCAHLAIFQRMKGFDPLHGLDSYPLDRVIEMHVAGGAHREHEGFPWVEDDHSPAVMDDTWAIFEHVVARAPNLRAVVFECERNSLDQVRSGFERIDEHVRKGPLGANLR